ncbi:MAG TPA: tryptophan synthase subunit alpha [Streptomyces sp.]|uniref:tryptophan synthase subunit alpha n=1 Tax=Streptomyces sp. TaxID=1931 RepID=UPI002B7FD7B7|nr:tryptophan synthase subunit alpha [Streptomyces sp.]HWU11001.1 tryptophan synthase subunit alpha [Streptomyces sp.]
MPVHPPHAPGRAALALDAAFRARGPLLGAYLPAGYPDRATSLDLLHQLALASDVVEVGWPYTDPMMDGPVIQEAGAQALAAGFTVRHLMETVRSLAPITHVLVMGYYQPLYRYGLRRAAEELAAAGAAGVILPDLNIDEAAPWLAEARRVGLHTVFVVAPTASDERLRRIAAAAGGMLYAPATSGVTGTTGSLSASLPSFVHRLRTLTSLPVGAGIGVSRPEQAARLRQFADAAIVGSAFIRAVRDNPGRAGIAAAAQLAGELRQALRLPAVAAA